MISQVKLGGVLSYVSMVINIIIGLVYTPWMIKSIGEANYGLYTLALSVINLFIFDFGLGTAVQRFVAKYVAEGNLKKANEFISITIRLYLALSLFIFITLVVVYAYLPEVYKGLTPEELVKFKYIFLVASIFSVISFPLLPSDGILSGTEKFIQLKLCDSIHKILLVICLSTCLILGYGVEALVIVSAVCGLLSLLLKLLCVYKYTDIKFSINHWDKRVFKHVISFTVWILIIAICQRCIISIAPTIVGRYHNADVIASFSIALSIEGYYYLFANALNGLFLPKVSQLIASNNEYVIGDLMIKVAIIQIYICGLLYLGLICFGIPFIQIWIGTSFNTVYYGFLILILPSFISLPQNIATTALVAKNKVKYQAVVSIIKAIINLVLAFPLCKNYGMLGMCIAISVSYLISVFLNNILYYKILKLNIIKFFKDTFIRYIIPLTLFVVFGSILNSLFQSLTWITFFIRIIIFGCLYLVVVPFLIGSTARNYLLKTISSIKLK